MFKKKITRYVAAVLEANLVYKSIEIFQMGKHAVVCAEARYFLVTDVFTGDIKNNPVSLSSDDKGMVDFSKISDDVTLFCAELKVTHHQHHPNLSLSFSYSHSSNAPTISNKVIYFTQLPKRMSALNVYINIISNAPYSLSFLSNRS